MEDFAEEIKEIEIILSLNSRANKSFAYSTLLHLQEKSTEHPSAIEALTTHIRSLVSSMISDSSDDDEEIGAQALKCLGFMIYQPSLVAAVQEDVTNLVVSSLAKLITTTKIKAVCNLGVWCISIQQLNVSILASHVHSLLRAVIHALDNPFGSLSTTFEAIQAVIKLAAQLGEKMRETSNIWAPPIYRRLLSIDKRERDMAERCLLKIKSIIFPPPLILSKALVVDIRKKLLSEMKEMLQNHGRKVHTIQAWGWFIRLLGSHALKNRHLVNEMLKIPEQTFSDANSQIQIASQERWRGGQTGWTSRPGRFPDEVIDCFSVQVAWEGLVDALIHPPIAASETNLVLRDGIQSTGFVSSCTCKGNDVEIQADGISKSIRLIMTPLVGVMSSKSDISVRSSCLNTWCYLLHKLDLSVNCPLVLKTVLEPILEVAFQMGPDSKNIWLWNSCLDLLDEFISAKSRDGEYDSNCEVSCEASLLQPPSDGKYPWKDYPIKWMPWDLGKLDFHLKMISVLIKQGSVTTLTPENRGLAYCAAFRISKSVLKGVRTELKNPSINYNEVMLCLNAILSLAKQLCEEVALKDFGTNDFLCTSLQFIEAITEELGPSLLASPLYKVALDLEYINALQSFDDIEYLDIQGMSSISYMNMVLPVVYLSTLFLCVVSQSISNESQMEIILHGMKKLLKFILSSYDPLESLCAIISLLYKYRGFGWLKLWIVSANALKEKINSDKDISFLKTQTESNGYVVVCWFLAYPIVVCVCLQKLLTPMKTCSSLEMCLVSSWRELDLEHVIEVWRSLYESVSCFSQSKCSTVNDFTEDLCGFLTKVFSENAIVPNGNIEPFSTDKHHQKIIHLSLFGEVVICLLKQILVLDDEGIRSKQSKNKENENYFQSTGMKNILEFIARFLRLSLESTEVTNKLNFVTSKVFSSLACFVGRLCLKQDILLFLEIISDPLVHWISTYALRYGEFQEKSIICQLQLFWTKTLNCLQRSRPPIIFDSSFLKVQSPILVAALTHPNSTISESTIVFWNYTYGNQMKLDYPEGLLPVLDKLSRNGRINLHKKSPLSLLNGYSSIEVVCAPLRYRVAASQKRRSKRVEFVKDAGNDLESTGIPVPGLKRKVLELTEHQKEVRRAQQGRERDCSGHGPGIRTYTSVDFSQGNAESQESQELRNPESILEMLKRVR